MRRNLAKYEFGVSLSTASSSCASEGLRSAAGSGGSRTTALPSPEKLSLSLMTTFARGRPLRPQVVNGTLDVMFVAQVFGPLRQIDTGFAEHAPAP